MHRCPTEYKLSCATAQSGPSSKELEAHITQASDSIDHQQHAQHQQQQQQQHNDADGGNDDDEDLTIGFARPGHCRGQSARCAH